MKIRIEPARDQFLTVASVRAAVIESNEIQVIKLPVKLNLLNLYLMFYSMECRGFKEFDPKAFDMSLSHFFLRQGPNSRPLLKKTNQD